MTSLIHTERGLQVRCNVDPEVAADREIGSPLAFSLQPSALGKPHWREIAGRHVKAALVSDGEIVGWISAARGCGWEACPRIGDIRWYATETEARRHLKEMV